MNQIEKKFRMKKHVIHLTFIALFVLFQAPVHAQEEECPGELPPDIDALINDPDILALENPLPNQMTCFPTIGILTLITPPNPASGFNAVAALSENLYKKTTGPVTRRSLLDEPALIPDHFSNCFWSFNADLFFNFSPLVYFTKKSPFLCSYIDLTNDNIINEIGNISVGAVSEIDVPAILGLFHNIKLRQYRVGFMFGAARQWENWLLSVRIPLYYQLEHFFLTEEEKQRIENNPFFSNQDAGEGASASDDVEKFLIRHLVSDKFGTGDTRLSLLGHFINCRCRNLWVGLQMTLPTAKTFTKGLIGGEFDPLAPIPLFNLQHFVDLKACPVDNVPAAVQDAVFTTEATNFLLDALDRLSTILINAPLGNSKHFGMGAQLDFRCDFNDYFSAHTYAALEGYFPRKETRFFLLDKTAEDLNRDWHNPDLAGENLAVLNRLIVSTLFPVGVRTEIWPGMKLQFNQALLYKSKHWDLKLGADFWYQAKEKMDPLLPVIPCDLPLVIPKAFRPAAAQIKVFGSVGYYHSLWDCIDWHASLNADGTVYHKGIGDNYTLSFRVGLEF